MLKIYISHPFTGAEKQNRQQARWLATKFAKQYPGVIFINPLLLDDFIDRNKI